MALHSRSLRDLAPFLLDDSTWPSLQLTTLLTGFGMPTGTVVTFYGSKINHSANSILDNPPFSDKARETHLERAQQGADAQGQLGLRAAVEQTCPLLSPDPEATGGSGVSTRVELPSEFHFPSEQTEQTH